MLDTTGSVGDFKAVIYSITNVPAERQKLMVKGGWSKKGFMGTLKDDFDFSDLKIPEGSLVTVMGTADVLAAPKEVTKFVEDMTEEEKAEKGVVIPAGMHNLGNTCYMNSTLQCLRHMPELRAAMVGVRPSGDVGTTMTTGLRDTFDALDAAGKSIPPTVFVSQLRRFYPQFAQTTPQGGFMQHDAEELMNLLNQALAAGLQSNGKCLDDFLAIDMEETLTCKESADEVVKTRTDKVGKLTCNIQGGPGRQNIEHMHEGLRLGLEGDVELHSDLLGRNAIWEKKQRIAKLPMYLCIHKMRFFWKETPENRDHAGVKCKIRKAVTLLSLIHI